MTPASTVALPTVSVLAPPLAVSTVGVVVIVLLGLVVALILTGFVAGRARVRRRRPEVLARIRAANAALAEARAADEGWDPAVLQAAARDAVRLHTTGDPDSVELTLVEVDDRPGVEDDRATFTALDRDRRFDVVLVRTGGAWHAVDPD